MLRAPALREAEEAEAEEERSRERFLQRNLQGGAYQSGVPYPFEMRQRLLSDYDNTPADDYAHETARRLAVANRWSVGLSTVSNYVKQREDLLFEADGGWQVSERVSKGASAKIRVRCGPKAARAPLPHAAARARRRSRAAAAQSYALDTLETLVHLNCGTSRTIAYFAKALNEWLETDFSEARLRRPCGARVRQLRRARVRRAGGGAARVRAARALSPHDEQGGPAEVVKL